MNSIAKIVSAVVVTVSLGLGAAATLAFGPDPVESLSARTRAALQLDPDQNRRLQTIEAAAQSTRQLAQEEMKKVRALLDAELAKPEPDLRRVVAGARTCFETVREQMQATMDNRLDLYDSLAPAQKTVVAEEIRQRLERLGQTRGLLLRFLGEPMQ